MNSIPDREKRRQSLQCRLYGLPRAYPRMQGEGMLERTSDPAALRNAMQHCRISPNTAISHQIKLKFGMMTLLLEGYLIHL